MLKSSLREQRHDQKLLCTAPLGHHVLFPFRTCRQQALCKPKHVATHSRHMPLSAAGVRYRISHKDLQDTRYKRCTSAPTETSRDKIGPDTDISYRHPKKKKKRQSRRRMNIYTTARPEATRKCRAPFPLRPFVPQSCLGRGLFRWPMAHTLHV